jgi:hypothetical protein
MNNRKKYTNSQIINGIAFGFSLAFLISGFIGSFYSGEWGHVRADLFRIFTSPGPLVTDYFAVGGLGSAFFNAGICGMFTFLMMVLLRGESRANTLAGYFLVVAHCFYGLNILNMMPCFVAPFLYLKMKKLDFKSNLHVCMFATSFAPFISELLFRYTQGENFVFGSGDVTSVGVVFAIIFAIVIGFVVPAILPGASAWHKGYNLYNGGLAFGIFGFLAYNFMYRTMGVEAPTVLQVDSSSFLAHGHSFRLYINCFYIIVFVLCILIGRHLNGNDFDGLYHLYHDTGFRSDFAEKYGMPICLINIGIYGLTFLAYLNLVIHFTEGAGFTGPTCGVMLAALTFTSMGQHPNNIWPILLGYQCLYLFTLACCTMAGRDITWTVSTQGYINGVAFATGMSPIVGRYGKRAGVAAGFMCASMCTATSALHGGLVLYNGGLTAGLTTLILLPILEHYATKEPRDTIKDTSLFNFDDLIAVNEHAGQENAKYYENKL